ncbi:MAG: plastocyanin/azurin family copper-binding protein [Patescibacteria group bacterium]
MNKDIIIGILAVALVAVGGAWLMQGRPACAPINVPPPTSATVQTPEPTPVAPVAPAVVEKPTSHTLVIKNMAFDKFPTVTIRKGDTIVWKNSDTVGHTVTGDKGGPASQTIPVGGTYSYTFTSVETFPYHCSIHPSMKAMVVVTE